MVSIVHPRSIKRIRFDDHPVEHEVLRAIKRIFDCLSGDLQLFHADHQCGWIFLRDKLHGSCRNTEQHRTGSDQVGPTSNFFGYGPVSKLILIFDMLAGRLELFPMLILFYPSTWKKRG